MSYRATITYAGKKVNHLTFAGRHAAKSWAGYMFKNFENVLRVRVTERLGTRRTMLLLDKRTGERISISE